MKKIVIFLHGIFILFFLHQIIPAHHSPKNRRIFTVLDVKYRLEKKEFKKQLEKENILLPKEYLILHSSFLKKVCSKVKKSLQFCETENTLQDEKFFSIVKETYNEYQEMETHEK